MSTPPYDAFSADVPLLLYPDELSPGDRSRRWCFCRWRRLLSAKWGRQRGNHCRIRAAGHAWHDVSGRPQVLLMLERLYEYISGHAGVRFSTFDEIADDFRARHPRTVTAAE